MKKLLLITLIAVGLFACKKELSNNDKAELAIKEYVKANFNDPESYETVEQGTLDSNFTNYTSDPFYEKLKNEDNVIVNLYDLEGITKSVRSNSKDSDLDTIVNPKKRAIINSLDSLKQNYKPEFLGYKMLLKFRAKNQMGATILQEALVDLDTNFVVTRFWVNKH